MNTLSIPACVAGMSADLASLDSGTGSASRARAASYTQHSRHSWSNDMSPQFCGVGSGRSGGSFSEIKAMIDSPFMETRASRKRQSIPF